MEQALVDTMDILTSDEYKGFWIRWAGGSIAVGREGESWPFMSWDDPDPFPVAYYGLSTNWSATGHWIVEGECCTPLLLSMCYHTLRRTFYLIILGQEPSLKHAEIS